MYIPLMQLSCLWISLVKDTLSKKKMEQTKTSSPEIRLSIQGNRLRDRQWGSIQLRPWGGHHGNGMQTTRRSNSWGMPQMVGLVGNTAISEGSFTVFMETQTLPRKKRTTLWCWVLQRHGPKVQACKRRVLCWKFCWNKPLKMNTDLIQLRLVCHIQWTFPCPTLCDLHTFKIHFISRILLRLQVHILSPRKQKWPADIQREPIAYDVLERSEVQNFYIFWHSKSSKVPWKDINGYS